MIKTSFEDVLARGEQIVALIEFGYPLYFQAPIGVELLTVIAQAEARRDVEQQTSTGARSVLDY